MKQPTEKKFTRTPDSSSLPVGSRAPAGAPLPAAYAIATAAAFLLGMAGVPRLAARPGPWWSISAPC